MNYLIIGGTSGIGNAIVQSLQENGHTVFLTGRTEKNVPSGAHYIEWSEGNNFPELGIDALDGLVYAPGTILLKPFHRYTEEELVNDYRINTLAAAKALQHYYPLLKKSANASVVLFSTVAVQTGMPFHASIAMAKGAIEGLTRALAAEWAPTIRVNTIAPSLTNTPLAEKLLSTPEKAEAGAKRHPLQKVGQASDMAAMATFLLSPHSGFITGQIIHIDGGIGNLKTS